METALPAMAPEPPGLEPGSEWRSTETGIIVTLTAYHNRGLVDHVAIKGRKLSRSEVMLPRDVFLKFYRLHKPAPEKPENRRPAMKFHPLAALFPLFDNDDLDRLCEDIEKNGLANPVVLYEGMILDGRNRYRACKELGIDPAMVEFTGSDPLAYVVSQNLNRRHLSESQRAMCAARITNVRKGLPMDAGIDPEDPEASVAGKASTEPAPAPAQELPPADDPAPAPTVAPDPPIAAPAAAQAASEGGAPEPAEEPPADPADEDGKSAVQPEGFTNQQAADALHVSERSVRSARVVAEKGIPALQQAVDRDQLSVSRAEAIARLPIERQADALAAALSARRQPTVPYLRIPASLGLWAAQTLGSIDLAPCWSSEMRQVMPASAYRLLPDNGAEWRGNVALVPTRRTLMDYHEQLGLALEGEHPLTMLVICEALTTSEPWQALAARADAVAFCHPVLLGTKEDTKPSARGLCVLAYSRNTPQPKWRDLLYRSKDIGLVVTP